MTLSSINFLTISLFLLNAILFSCTTDEEEPILPDDVFVSDDYKSVTLVFEKADSTIEISIQDWQLQAGEIWEEQVHEPVIIADMERRAEHFDLFGTASLSGDRTKLFITATTYAVATTYSATGYYSLPELELTLVNEPIRGSIEELVWSNTDRNVAFSLGSARASGDYLGIVDLELATKQVFYRGADIETVYAREVQSSNEPDRENSPQLKPHFHRLEWVSDDQIEFRSRISDSADRVAAWRYNLSDGTLKLLSEEN